MKLGKRTLAIGALLIAFAAVMATQYATVRAQTTAIITGLYPGIELMAHDKNITDGGWLLRRTGNTLNYTLHLGDLSGGQIKIWTAAFAIVNTEQHYKLRITGVRVWGISGGSPSNLPNYMEITLHKNPDLVGVPTNGYSPPSGSHWNTDSNATLYWKGTSIGGSGSYNRINNGWILGPGNGYIKGANPKMYYGNSTGWAKASYDTTNYVYNYTTYNSYNNLPTWGTDNYVWVQIIIDLSQVNDISSSGLQGTHTLYIEFFFEGTAV